MESEEEADREDGQVWWVGENSTASCATRS